jgi:hypothetical protein
MVRALKFYPVWYPLRWVGRGQVPTSFSEFGVLAKHLRYAERHARKLGRSLFHAMALYRQKLERKQMILFRAVDIGAELFAIAAACTRANLEARQGNASAIALADVFCREARLRIDALFDNLFGASDAAVYRLSQQVLRGEYAWLESGIVGLTDYEGAERWEAAVTEAETVGVSTV